jgi:NitT/TauT family transport system substrate-binding protein
MLQRLAAAFFVTGAIFAVSSVHAAEKVNVGVVESGTVQWLIDVIEHHKLDEKNGVDIEQTALAETAATKIALQGGDTNIITTDWLWVSRERQAGSDFVFVPFTTALGAVMVPEDSPIASLKDLKGKSLAVAGGALDKSWLLLTAYVLQNADIDLRRDTTQVFGASPLLTEKAKQKEVDAALVYWPYAARLEAAGFRQLAGIEEVATGLGAEGEIGMVGFAFSEAWAKKHPAAVKGFIAAANEANRILATDEEEWKRIRPLMRAEDDATFQALKRRYREGIPERAAADDARDAGVIHDFLLRLGGERLVGGGDKLAPGTFWAGGAE